MSTSINVISVPSTNEIDASAIPIGQYFYGQIGTHDSLFVRHYGGIVDLKNLKNNWIFGSCIHTVLNYQPIDEIEIIVKKGR